jgi:hypothetical protein
MIGAIQGKGCQMETVDPRIEETPARKSPIWMRGLFMLVFMLAFGVGQSILYLTAVAQFLWLLFANEPNKLLVEFGKSLALWLAQTARFLCCATDEKPFPMDILASGLREAPSKPLKMPQWLHISASVWPLISDLLLGVY